MDLHAITKLPPQKLALIAVVGVGGGLLWRRHAAKTAATPGTDGTVDTSRLALAENSAGNLAAAQTQQVPATNDATRDVGQGTITLPVVRWTIMIGNHEVLTNGTDIWELDGTPYVPTPQTAVSSTLPEGSPVGTPARTFGSTAEYRAAKNSQENAMRGMTPKERQEFMKSNGYI